MVAAMYGTPPWGKGRWPGDEKQLEVAIYGAPMPESERAPRPVLPDPLTFAGTAIANLQLMWEIAGHCPHCGAPIYSRRDPFKPAELPEIHYRCECRNKVAAKPKKKPARKRRKKAPNRKVKGQKKPYMTRGGA